jgi:hypothetical protein
VMPLVERHQDLRLLLMARRLRIGLAHHDGNLAAGITDARRPPLTAVDDVMKSPRSMRVSILVASEDATQAQSSGRRADFAVISGRSHCLCHWCRNASTLHVAGIRRGR